MDTAWLPWRTKYTHLVNPIWQFFAFWSSVAFQEFEFQSSELGGFTGNEFLTSVEVYNHEKNEWCSAPPLLSPRSGHAAAAPVWSETSSLQHCHLETPLLKRLWTLCWMWYEGSKSWCHDAWHRKWVPERNFHGCIFMQGLYLAQMCTICYMLCVLYDILCNSVENVIRKMLRSAMLWYAKNDMSMKWLIKWEWLESSNRVIQSAVPEFNGCNGKLSFVGRLS